VRPATPVVAPVLVIDDDPEARRILVLALMRAGLPVLEASSGEQCLRILEEREVSVVTCDMGMPGMSGLDVVRALRSRPQTATLPFLLVTGSGDGNTVIEALEAGADDFLSKPVRLDELVARVRAHIRIGSAWSLVVEEELHARASAVAALGRLTVSSDPQEAAELLVAELASRTGNPFIAILQITAAGGLQPLATFSPGAGVHREHGALIRSRGQNLLARARQGAWVQRESEHAPHHSPNDFWGSVPETFAGAPIYAGDHLVGILLLGMGNALGGPGTRDREDRLVAAAIDLASVVGATAGSALVEHGRLAMEQTRLRQTLTGKQYGSVYQPIVELQSRALIGNEALTRFHDGTAPDVHFREAAEMNLAGEYELAAVTSAIAASGRLPADTFLTINISAEVVVDRQQQLVRLLKRSARPIVLEVTEHEQITDYGAFLSVVHGLGPIRIAVDDAGAGYASLRHLVELQPAFAKLDVSLVRQIDRDPLRQAMAAGLAFYARRVGCSLIAEGVETEDEAATLAALGVELAQGYLFGRPAPI
jgi:EAL domain-containing protein (putative c-di-GMP-specific phosphodiesterase class I)/DNA-binding response OmpR family regulator